MTNILVPLCGANEFFDTKKYPYPKPLIEVAGMLMIELVIGSFSTIKEDFWFTFVIQKQDCQKFHLDKTLKLLTNHHCNIVVLEGATQGAACSALMAIDYIDTGDRLIIANGDQLIDFDMQNILDYFASRESDAGVACFDSVHPKWSYARIDSQERIIEMAEKKPISKHAVGGFYYYQHGSDFVWSAMQSIQKGANVAGAYYIAPTMNELILEGKKLSAFHLRKENYHSFYSPQKIKEFELSCAESRRLGS